MGRFYYEMYGIQSINLRIGTVQKIDTPKNSIRHFATWINYLLTLEGEQDHTNAFLNCEEKF